MAEKERLICASTDLIEGSREIRFDIDTATGPQSAFVVRHGGRVVGYLNRCAHIGIELDWQAGEFFDDSGLYLICATHGALYLPTSGECVAGPCRGAGLTPLQVCERDGAVYLILSNSPE
jgi:nitrite reductase/ring-hydroxylating ferredoxin subunit